MRGSARENPRLRQACSRDRRPEVLTDDDQAIQTRHLGFTISPHEECAVEEAVRLVEATGGEAVVLTLGPAEAEEQLRDSMAIGADRGILLKTDGTEWDPQATAHAIVEAIRAEEPFDLLLFGNESADAGNYQVGIRVAYALGLPVVNARDEPRAVARPRRSRAARAPARGTRRRAALLRARPHGSGRGGARALPRARQPPARGRGWQRRARACSRPHRCSNGPRDDSTCSRADAMRTRGSRPSPRRSSSRMSC
jgi:electron transfer flavoprotein